MPARLECLYEDEALLFVNKPAGLVVQRGYDLEEEVLLETVAEYLGAKGERAFLMQRLDKGTSGVIFFSKLSAVNANLTRQFERKGIEKVYLALCEGRLTARQRLDAPLLRVGPISFAVRRGGKRSITMVEPLAYSAAASLVRLHLLTGRTHQIRVHLAGIGHPLAGDWLYGQRNASRPMLHAASLEMRHPQSGELLRVEAPVPQDFLDEAHARGLAIPPGS